jgi:hypothetical protein
VKQWHHQKKKQIVEDYIIKKAGSEKGEPSRAPMPVGLHKLRSMVKDTWRFYNWSATQIYEMRQDMNKLLKHQGLPFEAILHPPPIFLEFPENTTSEGEDEGEKDRGSPLPERDMSAAHTDEEKEDDEPLSAKMARLRKETAGKKAMGTPTPVRARKEATPGRSIRRPADLSSRFDTDLELESENTIPVAEKEEDSFFSDDE